MENINALRRKTGAEAQLCSIRQVRCCGGGADGQLLYEVRNGLLAFSLAAGGCLDMRELYYRGTNLCCMPRAGLMAPCGDGNDDIPLGMFFTCGLKNVGPRTGTQPAHGTIRFQPAQDVTTFCGEEDGVCKLRVSGTMRQAGLFSEDLCVRRTVETEYLSGKVTVTDVVENSGYRDEEIMMLYHCNIGYPLLDEGTRLVMPAVKTVPRDAATAAARFGDPMVMDAPRDDYPEQVYYHELAADEDGNTSCTVVNDRLKLGMRLSFNINELPLFTQWKSVASGFYVMGLEPGVSHVEGMEREREYGTLLTLPAGGTRRHTITLDVRSAEQL